VGRRLTSQRTASIACPWSFSRFWDDEIVPLICPTCQGFGPRVGPNRFRSKPSVAAAVRLLCMGLFSLFLVGAAATRRDGTVRKARRLFRVLLKSWVLVWEGRKFARAIEARASTSHAWCRRHFEHCTPRPLVAIERASGSVSDVRFSSVCVIRVFKPFRR
jgi:hypothetical protein